MSTTTSRYKVLVSGIFCLMLTMGVARFAYTPMIPIMFEQAGLTKVTAGWLATINYFGYMCGALVASLVSNLFIKDRLYRGGLILAVLTTVLMGQADAFWQWAILRYLAGLASAAGLLIGAGLMLNWLIRHQYRHEMGIHFSGVGFGIALVAILTASSSHLGWSEQWLLLGFVGVFFAIPAWYWLPTQTKTAVTQKTVTLVDTPPSKRFLWLMMLVYFCAGFGFVISATYIVTIVENHAALKGQGEVAFLVLGLAAAPASIIWDYVSRQTGVLRALLVACVVHAIGIVLPGLYDSLSVALLSAALYGFTFIGIVSIVLTMAGRFYPSKPSKLMGILTMCYGIPQVVAPTIAGYLAEATGNYNSALYLACGFVSFGCLVILAIMKWAASDVKLLLPSR